MKNVILGDGITGYIIAACLNYNNEDFVIYGDGNYKAPSILLLKYKNDEERDKFFHIFEIPITEENISEYTLGVNVGFTNDYCLSVYNKPNQIMIDNYLAKQERSKNSSSMSNSDTSFLAIDLKKVYKLLQERYKNKFIEDDISIENIKSKYNKDVTIYNTIFKTEANNFEPSIEYICVCHNDTKGYHYVYDCNKNSNIKRLTPLTTEYFEKPGYYDFIIKNYYEEPKIYSTCNIKSNVTWIDISRNATKTQLKQEDIINYLVKDE